MSVEDWRTFRLADMGELNRGKSRHRPRDAKHLYGGAYPFVQTGDIKSANGLVTSYTQTYSEAGLAQSRLWPKGTVAITIAANIAETAILGFDACFPDSVVGFIADEEKTSGRFVEYLFRRLKRKIQHEHTGSGSVQDNINLGILNQLEFRVPPLKEQAKILGVLASLDDKIELNRRMNATLEDMARALFRDWFVDFGPTRRQMEGVTDPTAIMGNAFPAEKAAELAPLFPAKLGEDGLPEGWAQKPVSELTTLLKRGIAPKYSEEGCLVVNQRCIRNSSINFGVARRNDTSLRDPKMKELRVGDVLINSTGVGTLGRVATVRSLPERASADTHVSIVRPDENLIEPAVIALLLENMQDRIADMGHGSTGQTELKPAVIGEIEATVASREVQNAFGKIVGPLRTKEDANNTENQTLAEMRDLLLPKLMSGEIRLKDAEANMGKGTDRG